LPNAQAETLLARGVLLPAPEQVFVDGDVDPGRIAAGVVLFPGTRLHGRRTYLAEGVRIGLEGPATLRDCAFGPRASIASGYAEGAVLLRDAALGANAHVRPGTLLEEQVTTGHGVGLKQTVLLSFVTLGSLINFCDVLMAGGTSRADHSEVGSGFIHFNFTPWGKSGDKATPSLVGDAVNGVFLDRARIFLGGSAGLVGPGRVGFGSVAAAGQVVRRDVPAGHLVLEAPAALSKPMRQQARRAGPVVERNAAYMGELAALCAWYREVRARRAPAGPPGDTTRELAAAAVNALELGLEERWQRLAAFLGEQGQAVRAPDLEVGPGSPLELVDLESDHVAWVQGLGNGEKHAARAWLGAVAREVAARVERAARP
jgi:UDP-N-acetylglucosamine/UDP-N-acetylgalactosamine diphosphorylase